MLRQVRGPAEQRRWLEREWASYATFLFAGRQPSKQQRAEAKRAFLAALQDVIDAKR